MQKKAKQELDKKSYHPWFDEHGPETRDKGKKHQQGKKRRTCFKANKIFCNASACKHRCTPAAVLRFQFLHLKVLVFK